MSMNDLRLVLIAVGVASLVGMLWKRFAGRSARRQHNTMSGSESTARRYVSTGLGIGLAGLGVAGAAVLIESPRMLDVGIALVVIGAAIQVFASAGLGFLEGWRSKRDERDDSAQ